LTQKAFIVMKNLRLKFAAAALILGIGSAMATTHHAFANRTWGYDQSTGKYIEVSTTPGYSCVGSAQTCTADYPLDVDPNNQAGDAHPGTAQPSNIILGDFDQ
jgi:hypothetical protein